MRCLVNILETEQLSFEKWGKGDNYGGTSAEIAEEWKSEKLGFHVETLHPKKFSCPYHLHHKEEELFYVLDGSATVRQDGEFFKVNKGDLVLFKTGVAHQFYNHTDQPFLFLALSNVDHNEVCEYPDSKKKMDLKEKKITQDGVVVDDYWKDEESPQKYWPSDII